MYLAGVQPPTRELLVCRADGPGGEEYEIVESLSDVRGRLAFGPTKTFETRWVPMPDFVAEALREHVEAYPSPVRRPRRPADGGAGGPPGPGRCAQCVPKPRGRPRPDAHQRRSEPALTRSFSGADDGIRTRDPHLGKVLGDPLPSAEHGRRCARCGGDSASRRLPARVDWQADWQAGGSAGVFPVRALQSLQQTHSDSASSDEYAAPGTFVRWHAPDGDSNPCRHLERAQASPHGGAWSP
jgi:hypothetical protein